jgi:hypothetical protein
MLGDGARGVEKGATVTVRDVRALRVKLLNHAKLIESIGGYDDKLLADIDSIGVTDDDKRGLLVRALGMLSEIASTSGMRSSVRWRALKTMTETITELAKDRTKARTAAAQLAQQSNEHADKVKLKERELDIAEGMVPGGSSSPLHALSTDELKRIRDASAPKP